MIRFIILFQLTAAPSQLTGQIDSICREKCKVIAVQDNDVKLIDQWLGRTLTLGKYAPAAVGRLPPTEAPVLDLKSSNGWRIIASDYIDHQQDEIEAHVRFFRPDGKLNRTTDVLATIEQGKMALLEGGSDAIFAITSSEEHAYNAQTEIWLLPRNGSAWALINIQGNFEGFIGAGRVRGVRIAKQTYDGLNANTKGIVYETYIWHPETHALTLSSH